MQVLYPGWIGIWRCWFLRREEKSENPEKNPRSKAWTKKKPQPANDTLLELNPGHIGGRQALLQSKNLPIDETIDIVFKNHFHFFFHLLLQMEYKNSH